jgi:hypothetical protein
LPSNQSPGTSGNLPEISAFYWLGPKSVLGPLRSLRPFFANFAVKDFAYSKIKFLTAKVAKKSREGRKENIAH